MARRFATVTQTVTYEVPDVETRVRRGVALLDKKVPGWWENIDLTVLNMGSGSRCVVGQLAIKSMLNGPLEDYEEGIKKLFTEKQIEAEEPARHGFDIYETEVDGTRTWLTKQPSHHPWQSLPMYQIKNALYSLLGEVWIQIITGRQASKAKA